MNYQFALFLVVKDHARWGFAGKRVEKPHRGEVSIIEGRCISIFRIIRSSVRFTWWGLSKWSRFHSERFPAFFCFFQKTRKNAFWGGNLEIILRSGDVCVKMTGSGNWIFEIRWGLPIFGEVYHTMRFYDKRWGFDHPMRFMIRWCFRFSVRFDHGDVFQRIDEVLRSPMRFTDFRWGFSRFSTLNLTENRKHHRIINLIGWSKPHRLS